MIKRVLVVISTLLLGGCQSVTDPAGSVDVATPPQQAAAITNDPALLGRQHFERGDYALAEKDFRTAVERNPTDGPSWTGLAASYDQLGRFDLADRAYDQAVKFSGQTFEVLNDLGFSYMLRGDKSRARSMFDRAKALRPNDPVVNNNLALLSGLPVVH